MPTERVDDRQIAKERGNTSTKELALKLGRRLLAVMAAAWLYSGTERAHIDAKRGGALEYIQKRFLNFEATNDRNP